jgi:hypothetical protein
LPDWSKITGTADSVDDTTTQSKFPDWMKSKTNLFAEHERRYIEGKERGERLTKELVFEAMHAEMMEVGFDPYFSNYQSFRTSKSQNHGL